VKYTKEGKTKRGMDAFTTTVKCAVFTESGISFVLERFRPTGTSIIHVDEETVVGLSTYEPFPIVSMWLVYRSTRTYDWRE
jgi:hypothetical protein